jgi:hypothetical protein
MSVIRASYGGPPVSTVWNALDNREKALLFWVGVLIVVGLRMQAGRSFLRTMAGIVRGRFSLILLAYVLYVASLVVLLAWVGLWLTEVASATAFWFAGPGMLMFFTSTVAITDPHYLRSLVRRALWILLGIEFVVNLYVFPLAVEILLLPVLTFIALFGVLPSDAKGAAGAKKVSEAVLAAFGVFLFVRFLVLVVTDWGDFASSETLARFWVPPVLTLAVLPFFYVLGVYMLYEQAFLRLGFFMEDESLVEYAKKAFVRRFGLNLGELREVGSGPLQVKVARAGSQDEIDAILRETRRPLRWKHGKRPRRPGDAPESAHTAIDA